jgi:hypothetical protein
VALHNQVRAFEATSGVACAISTGLQSRLTPDLETVLYRVTQESLNNVGKHAGASRVTVSLAAENGSVRLRINDDGAGFDPAAVLDAQGRIAAVNQAWTRRSAEGPVGPALGEVGQSYPAACQAAAAAGLPRPGRRRRRGPGC